MFGILLNVRSLSGIQWVTEAPLVILISPSFLSLSLRNILFWHRITLVLETGMQHRSFRKWRVLITGA